MTSDSVVSAFRDTSDVILKLGEAESRDRTWDCSVDGVDRGLPLAHTQRGVLFDCKGTVRVS